MCISLLIAQKLQTEVCKSSPIGHSLWLFVVLCIYTGPLSSQNIKSDAFIINFQKSAHEQHTLFGQYTSTMCTTDSQQASTHVEDRKGDIQDWAIAVLFHFWLWDNSPVHACHLNNIIIATKKIKCRLSMILKKKGFLHTISIPLCAPEWRTL